MKKLVALIILAMVVLSCSTPKTVIQSKKVIKGVWKIDNIAYSEEGTFNVLLLNDVAKECFEGSEWHFIPNNNTGNYTIVNSDCSTGIRYFRFTIQEVNVDTGLYAFLLKPTDEKYKSDEYNRGFRLKLAQLSESSMTWEQTVSVDSNPFTISMNFSKVINDENN
jgi:hypothetical protein